MHERMQTLASGAILVLIIGWILYVGKAVFVPIVFSIFAAYVIVGLARMLAKVPWLGSILPTRVRYAISMLLIAVVMVEIVYLAVAAKDTIAALAPRFQELLLRAIQKATTYFHIESEPTWATLRQDLIATIDVQKFLRSMFASVSSTIVGVELVVLFTGLLLFEHRGFLARLASLSNDSRSAARMQEVFDVVSVRIGSYLVLKTLLGTLLGVMSWIAMAFIGLEFAMFWAVLIGALYFVPYIGPVLGIALSVTMAIVQFANLNEVLALLLALLVAYAFVGYFLDPYVMGSSLNLSPLAILGSLTLWAELWGIPGAFLAIPITTIVTIVLSEFSATRQFAILLSRDGRP
jgi:AI-2 transport protein TqsA